MAGPVAGPVALKGTGAAQALFICPLNSVQQVYQIKTVRAGAGGVQLAEEIERTPAAEQNSDALPATPFVLATPNEAPALITGAFAAHTELPLAQETGPAAHDDEQVAPGCTDNAPELQARTADPVDGASMSDTEADSREMITGDAALQVTPPTVQFTACAGHEGSPFVTIVPG